MAWALSQGEPWISHGLLHGCSSTPRGNPRPQALAGGRHFADNVAQEGPIGLSQKKLLARS